MVLVQFRVKVTDIPRFKATNQKYKSVMEGLGGRNLRAYVAESDPNEVCTLSEWESHDPVSSTAT